LLKFLEREERKKKKGEPGGKQEKKEKKEGIVMPYELVSERCGLALAQRGKGKRKEKDGKEEAKFE